MAWRDSGGDADSKQRATLWCIADLNATALPTDDLVANRKTKPGPLYTCFSCKEGFEDLRLDLAGHAWTRVGSFDEDACRRFASALPYRDGQGSSFGLRLHGI